MNATGNVAVAVAVETPAVGTVSSDISDTLQQPVVKEFSITVNVEARYVRVFAKSYGKLPSWHESAGEPSWLFVDEIVIR